MKIKYALLITAFLAGNHLLAQYPCVNGISTNPANPINSQLPSKRNTFFNWQDSLYNVQPINTDCIRGTQIESPFYKINNLEALRESKDMLWTDGWELILRGFGLSETNTYTTDPVPSLYLVMYNKYTGILRVLLKVCRGADYNAAKITIKFDGTSQMKTDLLEFSRDISALDKKFTSTVYAAGSIYVNDNTKWLYADFPMMYDPCTCAYRSKLNIISELIVNSSISLEGGITGDIYTKDVGGKAQIQKPGSFGWKDFAGLVNGKVSTVYNGINGFVSATQGFASNVGNVDTVNKKSALDNLGSFLKNNAFLKAGLSAVPWLKSAVSLVDAFIGGGKAAAGPQEVKLLPLAVNLSVKLNGTISTANQYHDIKFTNPGSKDAALDPDIYPYYNEVMGVFNLIKTPVVFLGSDGLACCDVRRCYPNSTRLRFKFAKDSLQYVLNPAAGLTIQNMKAAIVTEATNVLNSADTLTNRYMNADFPEFEGKDAITRAYKFRTDYFDINCLDQRLFTVINKRFNCNTTQSSKESKWYPGATPKLYLKLMINLKRNVTSPTTQNVLLVLTYPLKVVSNLALINGVVQNLSCVDSTVIPPATDLQINSFCNNATYFNSDRLGSQVIDSLNAIDQMDKKGIALSPNPNNGNFRVLVKAQKAKLQAIRVIDMSGRAIFSSNEGQLSLENGFTKQMQLNLRPGTYIIVAATTKGLLKSRFIVGR
jgi:hypothetical protein